MCSKSLKPSMSAATAEGKSQRQDKGYHSSAGLVLSMTILSKRNPLQEMNETHHSRGAHGKLRLGPRHSYRARYVGARLAWHVDVRQNKVKVLPAVS